MSRQSQIEGKNPVLESLRSGRKAEKIFILSTLKHDEKVQEILILAKKNNIPVYVTDQTLIQKMSKTPINQGVIGLFEPLPQWQLKEYLEQVESRSMPAFMALFTAIDFEQNLGAVLRTAEAAGMSALVIPPRAVGITPVVERISMGSSSYIPVITESIFPALKTFKEYGYAVIGLEVSGEKDYFTANLRGKVVFVIGGEDKGITVPIAQRCDEIVKIPQRGKISSLNMSVAFGIVAFEKVRQDSINS